MTNATLKATLADLVTLARTGRLAAALAELDRMLAADPAPGDLGLIRQAVIGAKFAAEFA